MKKINIPNRKISRIIKRLTAYTRVLIFVLFSALIGLLITRAGESARIEPSNSQVEEMKKRTSIKRVDQSAVDKLKELEAKNISLEALFDNGRTNPFEN